MLMATTIGFVLSGVVALAIVFIGARFIYAPYLAASGYGISVLPRQGWDAYLSAKGIRDIASGIFTAILIANRSAWLLGLFMLAATIIPVTDAAIVLRHRGPRRVAFGVHGVTAAFMLVTAALLLLG
jgi:hypothetical protein